MSAVPQSEGRERLNIGRVFRDNPAIVLTLVKTILILKGVDQNWAQVIQGSLIIVVVMIGGLAIRERRRT